MGSKYSPENLLRKILELDAIEFLGVCKILGVSVYKEKEDVEESVEESVECGRPNEETNATEEPKDFYEIWDEVCDVIAEMNRTRRRNLGRLIYPATKKEK